MCVNFYEECMQAASAIILPSALLITHLVSFCRWDLASVFGRSCYPPFCSQLLSLYISTLSWERESRCLHIVGEIIYFPSNIYRTERRRMGSLWTTAVYLPSCLVCELLVASEIFSSQAVPLETVLRCLACRDRYSSDFCRDFMMQCLLLMRCWTTHSLPLP